jgi:hypothetical protein
MFTIHLLSGLETTGLSLRIGIVFAMTSIIIFFNELYEKGKSLSTRDKQIYEFIKADD